MYIHSGMGCWLAFLILKGHHPGFHKKNFLPPASLKILKFSLNTRRCFKSLRPELLIGAEPLMWRKQADFPDTDKDVEKDTDTDMDLDRDTNMEKDKDTNF